MESKLKATPSSLCDGLPVQIGYIFEYTKSLDFYEDPDYRFISIELANAIEACCDESNLQYDWETLPEGTHFCEGELNIVYPEQRVEEEPSKST